MSLRRPCAAALLLLAWPGPASACSPPRNLTDAEVVRSVRSAIDQATAIVDAEVVGVTVDRRRNTIVTRLRVLRVWKGPRRQWIEVGEANNCDLSLSQVHARYRIVLDGGPNRYNLPSHFNGFGGGDPGLFNRELDRRLGSRRPPGFQSAVIPLPPKAR